MKRIFFNSATIFVFIYIATPLCGQTMHQTTLSGTLLKADSALLKGQKVYLLNRTTNLMTDSVAADSNAVFRFQNFELGIYSIGINLPGVDNSIADKIEMTTLNPKKINQHFYINDGSLVCTESNYSSLKAALENKEHVYELDLNSLQYDVAEKSLKIGTDGSKTLSEKIGELKNLETLTLNINQINSISSEIGKLTKLRYLSANLNKLTELPSEISTLKNLTYLDLGKNNFSQFPKSITALTSLAVLNFEGNAIAALPSEIGLLKNLKELNLENCSTLLSLPIEIGSLENLEVLNLAYCIQLKSLPVELINLKKLRTLDVTGTKISVRSFQKERPDCEIRK